jgi:DNA-binding CsgD family transcriptional regulator/PAS domain-containing protein
MVDVKRLQEASARLGDAAVDPRIWPEIMQQIATAATSQGAVLLQGDVRTQDVPRTAGVDAYVRSYFADGWHARDFRAAKAVPLLLQGEQVVIDQDILPAPEDMRRVGLYAESLIPHGLQWFAGIGFRSGPDLWGLTLQRTRREGPFEPRDKPVLAQLSQRLTDAATLSHAVGKAILTGIVGALGLVGEPALALDRSGSVLDMNPAAEQIFDDEVRVSNRRFVVRDRQARAALGAFLDQMRTTLDLAALRVAPIPVRRSHKPPLLIRAMPVDPAARGAFLGARALLVFTDLGVQPVPDTVLLARTFGLTPAETRFASLVARGFSPQQAADELEVGYETVRCRLKALFDKTGTHRQSELVRLLARLSWIPPADG